MHGAPVDLFAKANRKTDVDDVVAAVEESIAEYGGPRPNLIFVDTVSRNFGGGDQQNRRHGCVRLRMRRDTHSHGLCGRSDPPYRMGPEWAAAQLVGAACGGGHSTVRHQIGATA